MLQGWHKMSEVYDAMPEAGAHMLVGPYDLTPVVNAYLAFTPDLSERPHQSDSDLAPAPAPAPAYMYAGTDAGTDADVENGPDVDVDGAVAAVSLWGKMMTGHHSFEYREIYLKHDAVLARQNQSSRRVRESTVTLRLVGRGITRRLAALADHLSANQAATATRALGNILASGAFVDPQVQPCTLYPIPYTLNPKP
jgi:hypothetical protein